MKYVYNKLVRDYIPENLNQAPGKSATYRMLGEEEYIVELNKKLLEEANEFVVENAIEELADMFEVIQSIMKVRKICYEDVKKVQDKKRKEKGGFDKRVYLIDVEE